MKQVGKKRFRRVLQAQQGTSKGKHEGTPPFIPVRVTGGKSAFDIELELTDGQSIDPVVDLLRARGLSIRHLIEKRQTLEELFMETVQAAEPGVDAPVRGER